MEQPKLDLINGQQKTLNLSETTTKLADYLEIDDGTVYIIKLSDLHNMECINDADNLVKMISGFTGSLAILFITKNKKYIMTDSRYYLQVELELDKSWELIKLTKEWPITIKELFHNKVGIYDGKSISVEFHKKLKDSIPNLKISSDLFLESKIPNLEHAIELARTYYNGILREKVDIDKFNYFLEEKLIKPINYNQLETTNLSKIIFELSEKITGESTQSKVNRIKSILTQKDIPCVLISDLNDIAWVLNIRAFSYEFNPVPKGFLLIHKTAGLEPCLYLEEIEPFKHSQYKVHSISDLVPSLNNLTTLLIDSNTLSMKIIDGLSSSIKIDTQNYKPISLLKCIKNTHELSVLKEVHLMDSLTILKFWKHFETENEISTEKELSQKLEFYRKQNRYYLIPSFSSIIAKGSNASIVHYNPYSTFAPKPTNNIALSIDLTLCDIGGQYINGGTTDVTRVFIKPTKINERKLDAKEKKDFDKIKKAYTALIKAKFTLFSKKAVCGVTKGIKFHELVSHKMKEFDFTYGHGTGHGIGNLGAVHEGPVGLYGEDDLPNNIVTSVEPGYYETGNFGLRLEDAVYTEKKDGYTEFKILTKVPYERKLINKEMLEQWEINHINNYHKSVEKELVNYVSNEENINHLEIDDKEELIKFIREKCREI